MINFIQLLINDPATAELDLDNSFDIALQYSLADIRDISKRNSAYSKTIILPGTKKNNYWLGYLFDINSDFTFFNPNRKTNCKFLVNSETVINGFLQLRKINKLVNADAQGNKIQYEVVIYNNAVDLMTELGESTLYQLNLFDFNHTFNQAAIEASWQHTWEDGYVYPMYGTDEKNYQYDADWFWPSPFYKQVFDRIISDAGYGWTGSFRNNEQFEKEIIAYVKDGNVYVGADETERRQFRAGITQSNLIDYGQSQVSFSGGWPLLYPTQPDAPYGTPIPNNDDFTSPNFDNGVTASNPDGNYNTSTFEWTVDRNGGYRLDFGVNYDFIFYNPTAYTANWASSLQTTFRVNLYHRISTSIDGGATWQTWDGVNFQVTFSASGIGAGASLSAPVNFDWPMQDVKNLTLGTLVKLEVEPRTASQDYYPYQSYNTPGGAAKGMNVRINWRDTGNYILNHAEPSEITQGDVIDLGQFLPDKLKQKDLISDLIKRYNLYIEVSPDDDKLLVFTERPNYYSSGDTLDWTSKKDYSSEDNIELLSELQFKEFLFTYKADKDKYNDYYERETGDIYGQYEYVFDNDFVKGQKKIESPFSPTPLVKTQFGAYVAAIDPEDPKTKPRFLYWGGLKSYGENWEMTYQDVSPTGGGQDYTVVYNTYPYAGHWDDPIQPTLDIHFDTPKKTFFTEWEQIPTNTMYNTYWSDYISQIEDGRLVTSSFNLTENDIKFIKDNFNTKIFVLDSYYYINKIIDYKPLENGLTKVELIRVRDGINWQNEGNSENTASPTASCPVDMVTKRYKQGWFHVSASGQTVTEECCNLSNGIWNAGQQTCKARIKPVEAWIKKSVGAETPIVTGGNGNEGPGPVIGNRNTSIGTKTVLKYSLDYDWILSLGSWDDSGLWIDTSCWQDSATSSGCGGATYSFITNNTQFTVGDNNTLTGDNNFNFGSGNILNVDNASVYTGDNNTVNNSSVLIGSNGLDISGTSPTSVYLGNSFSVNIDNGDISAGGKFKIGYGSSATPSVTWDDSFLAGFWKNGAGERSWHLGVLGVTVSSITNDGMSLNDLVLEDHRYNYREQETSYTIPTGQYTIVAIGTQSDTVFTLPSSADDVTGSGKILNVKNLHDDTTTIDVQGYYEVDSVCSGDLIDTTDLQFYLKMDNNVIDSSGNGNNGTATAITYSLDSVAAPFNYTGVFNGSTSKVTIATQSWGLTTSFSMGCWFRTSVTASNQYLMNQDDVGANKSFQNGIDTTNVIRAGSWDSGGTFRAIIGVTDVCDGQWHHFMTTFDKTNGQLLYVDGVIDGANANTNDRGNGSTTTYLGVFNNPTVPPFDFYHFPGDLDEFIMSSRTFTAAEVTALAAGTCPLTTPNNSYIPVDTWQDNGGNLQFDVNTPHGYATGSYVEAFNSSQYGGPYEIISIDSTLLFTVDTPYTTGGISGGETVNQVSWETIDKIYNKITIQQYDSISFVSMGKTNGWVII
jgi:hypothetical protein